MKVVRSLASYLIDQSYKRVARVIRHAVGYCLLGYLVYAFEMTRPGANATAVALSLLAAISAALIFELAGLKGLQSWNSRQPDTTASAFAQTQTTTAVAASSVAAGPAADAADDAAGDPK